jgi:serine/threonine-protein kinase
VYDHGETALPDGSVVTYLVLELVEGRTLAARLIDGPLPWPEAARIAGQVASALAAAHRVGLVHRDVKPANVMLTDAGAKMLDFGIAALTGPAGRAARRTDAVAPGVGTPAYAAPEWLTGAPPHPASDVYGVGALLHEALTGQPAVRARTWAEAAEFHRSGDPLPPPDVPGLPPRVAELCLACLAPDPRDRPSAADVAGVLDGGRAGASPRRRLRPTLVRRGVDAGKAGSPTEPAVRPAGSARRPSGPTVRRPRAGRTRLTVRPAGVALLGAVAAGVLVFALAAAALLDRRTPDAEAVTAPAVAGTSAAAAAPRTPTPAAPSAGAAGPASTAPDPVPNPDPTAGRPGGPPDPPPEQASPTAVVEEFDRRLASAASAGLVRADVAVDLRNGLTDLRDRISRGQTGELRPRAENLRRKLAERVAERAIDARTAAQLAALLDPLLTA